MFQSVTDIVRLYPTKYVIYISQLQFVSWCLHVLASAAVFVENTLSITQRCSNFYIVSTKEVVTNLVSTKSCNMKFLKKFFRSTSICSNGTVFF
jgi:hypothetical protein